MIEAVETVSRLQVGKFYLVNTVIREFGKKIIPIHGALHEDAEIINFPFEHWHIDWRFVDARTYEFYRKAGGGWFMPWAWPINRDNSIGPVVRRKLKCKRQFGPYMPKERILWLRALEEKYRDAKMKNLICPHKGLPCNATPTVDNVVICRGHGLAFNVKTGVLVRQTTSG